jgi:hypothetical protein
MAGSARIPPAATNEIYVAREPIDEQKHWLPAIFTRRFESKSAQLAEGKLDNPLWAHGPFFAPSIYNYLRYFRSIGIPLTKA